MSHRNAREEFEYGKKEHNKKPAEPVKEKEKPNLGLSGNLAKDTNTFNGVVIKYNEPPEARKPKKRWRLYCFKDETELPFYPMHRQSAYLFGRNRMIADIPIDHPSCSQQHAVFQYRLVDYKRQDGTNGRIVKPYIIDLGSTNGTFVNNNQIEAQRYFELREKDTIKFGFSSRQYILLHEESKGENLDELDEDEGDDDVGVTESEEKKEVKIKQEKPSPPPKFRNQQQPTASSSSASSYNRDKDRDKDRHLHKRNSSSSGADSSDDDSSKRKKRKSRH